MGARSGPPMSLSVTQTGQAVGRAVGGTGSQLTTRHHLFISRRPSQATLLSRSLPRVCLSPFLRDGGVHIREVDETVW
ncbi:hypothetical protein E2C01_070531 [Portunus trituberculatus]|uniref:Uncharacterized protein n=1 Tax=Portunus trituberculatus TaxID=210409 RepID=A0A5B7I2C5_PORTR|nr:hypothetical protein [Portunus trituberculatus]